MNSLDGFIGTFSGLRFWPLDPNPEKILIADIAHALALQCRKQTPFCLPAAVALGEICENDRLEPCLGPMVPYGETRGKA